MKRGKRFFEKDNLFIYVGTAIFFVLAIALGIIMFMLSRTTSKLGKESGQVVQESQTGENAESVSTEIGKSVQEQEKKEEIKNEENISNQTASNNTSNTNLTNDANNSEKNKNTTSSVKTTNAEKPSNSVKNGVNQVDEPDTKSENNNSNANVQNNVVETKKEITFVKPTEGDIICEYAKDNLIYSETLKEWITHTAIDIKADKTSVIKASADGIVKSIVNDPRYGLTVIIEHDDGYETVYANLLTAEFVVVGEEVAQGQTIGTAGNTASFESSMECHLHFELIKDGEYLDPAIYLK